MGQSLPKEFINTIFIGIDFQSDPKAAAELAVISLMGGDTSEIYTVQNADISQIFERIKLELGLQVKHKTMAVRTGDQTLLLAQERAEIFL